MSSIEKNLSVIQPVLAGNEAAEKAFVAVCLEIGRMQGKEWVTDRPVSPGLMPNRDTGLGGRVVYQGIGLNPPPARFLDTAGYTGADGQTPVGML